jgi:succinate dehydrogenase/fumarate reductase-like Fe-S protein
MAQTTTLAITRQIPGGEPRVEEFTVPYHDGLTLLEAIMHVRRTDDPSLGVRFSCKANACKECSATIDGKPGFLCAIRAKPDETTKIEPLKKPRLIRDLVTELY